MRHAGPPGNPGSYDGLDLLTAGLLGSGVPAEPSVELEPEMVRYQPSPARAIVDLGERADICRGDVFFDLGSGLGQVVILVALLRGARGWGVELEPAYCEYARQSARRMKVPGVEFIQADARTAPLAGGTVYFLYTPFRRALLRQVLERLEAEARARPIRVCTLGPCTAEVAGTHWLAQADGRALHEHEVAVFRSR
jgi:SAM-dependent methyltransferase